MNKARQDVKKETKKWFRRWYKSEEARKEVREDKRRGGRKEGGKKQGKEGKREEWERDKGEGCVVWRWRKRWGGKERGKDFAIIQRREEATKGGKEKYIWRRAYRRKLRRERRKNGGQKDTKKEKGMEVGKNDRRKRKKGGRLEGLGDGDDWDDTKEGGWKET